MEKVKQEGALRAAEAIQANMSEDAEKAAAALEQQEREASERLAELKAAEEQFASFQEQLIRKAVSKMRAAMVQEFFDRWIDLWQDAKDERGELLTDPRFPDGQVGGAPPPLAAKAEADKGAGESQPEPEPEPEPEAEAEPEAEPSGEGEAGEGPEEEEGEGQGEGRVGATLESDPAEVLQG